MKIAALIPVVAGNDADDLVRCLASVASQTHRDMAVRVLVSGGEDKAIESALERFTGAFPDLEVIRLTERLTAAEARNALWDAAGTDAVAFLDSDDEWQPDHLSRFAERAAGKPELFYFTDFRLRQSGAVIRFTPPERSVRYLMRQPIFISTICILGRRVPFKNIRAEDFLFAHDCLQLFENIHHEAEVMAIYDLQRTRRKTILFRIKRTYVLLSHIRGSRIQAALSTALFILNYLRRAAFTR